MLEIVSLDHNSPEWWEARRGIPTASAFSRIVTGTGKASDQRSKYAAELAANSYGALSEGFSTQWTKRGTELEPEAREYYSFTRGVELVEHQYATTDVWQGFGISLCGASPDAVIGDCGLLEVKCLSEAEHVMVLHYYAKNSRPKPQYIPQTQGQLLVWDRRWVDLLYYHPDLPELCIRVDRDDEFCSKLVAGINAVTAMRDEYLATLEAA